MAFDTAYLQNPHTGQIKEAPLGFSWTMLFFGFFPPMFRGDWKWFGIILGIGFLFAIMSAGFLGWVPALVGAFIWNKSYLDNLIGRGYKLKGTGSGNFERVDGIVGYEVPRLESV